MGWGAVSRHIIVQKSSPNFCRELFKSAGAFFSFHPRHEFENIVANLELLLTDNGSNERLFGTFSIVKKKRHFG